MSSRSLKQNTPTYVKASRWFMYIKCSFFILIGLALAGWGAYELAAHGRITEPPNNSVKADGKGEIVDIKCMTPSCVMSIKYTVKGSLFQSTYTSPATYKQGDKVNVFVDENNYSKIILVGDPPSVSPWFLIIIGAIITIISGSVMYFSSKSDTFVTTATLFSLAN